MKLLSAIAREQIVEHENEWLAIAATRSEKAHRLLDEAPSDVRTEFQRDRDRILHSKSFRRLQSKTQVFLPPAGDHARTRLTHTLEVTQIARTISRALRLNEDLTEAIALGHDLGHTPFGHAGEDALAGVFPGFRHNEQSLRIVEKLENNGRGLNLTFEVRDGILRHSKPVYSLSGDIAGIPRTAEAQVVKISDGIAYINHDLDDALRFEILTIDDVPEFVLERLGNRHSERIDTLVKSVILNSAPEMNEPLSERQVISMSPEIMDAADQLRTFLFKRVYEPVNQLPSTRFAANIVKELFHYYVEHPDDPALSDVPMFTGEPIERRVADFISGMTDRYAQRRYTQIFIRQT